MRSVTILFIGVVSLLFSAIITIPGCVEVEQTIKSPLMKAADAPTLRLAVVSLSKAVKGIEARKLTDGCSSILYCTDDDRYDIWYSHLYQLHQETDSLMRVEKVSSLAQSNHLMKLRETITEPTEKGYKVTHPQFINTYPNHILPFSLVWIGIICIMIGMVWWSLES